MLNPSLEFDTAKALRLRKVAIGRAQTALDLQVIKDSNFFCPEAEGTLQASALTASDVGKGLVLWATPYARRQYYEAPNKSKDKNPNARMKWFEEAKARQRENWLSITRREAGANA